MEALATTTSVCDGIIMLCPVKVDPLTQTPTVTTSTSPNFTYSVAEGPMRQIYKRAMQHRYSILPSSAADA